MPRLHISLVLTTAALLTASTARAQFSSTHKPACSDGVDNDGDGKTDYPADPGCDGPNDDSEAKFSFPASNKARIIVLFDTSGSMTWDVCGDNSGHYPGGDGSRECPGLPEKPAGMCTASLECGQNDPCPSCNSPSSNDNVANDTRIFKVKKGLSDAIKAYGEIDWSLYRFFQSPNAFTQFDRGSSANPRFDCSAAPCSGNIGKAAFAGWHGSLNDDCQTDSESGVNYKRAQQLVRFGPENQQTLLQWMDNQSNWDENSGKAPSGFDFELRGSGHTPLGDSLTTIKDDLANIKAADPIGSCRPYAIIIVTDGQENCGNDPAAVAKTINDAGTPVYVIGVASSAFATADNNIASNGGTGSAFLADEPDQLAAAIAQIVAKTVKVEKCNGLDDDCDGVIDNGFNVGDACTNGEQGACFRNGTFVCNAAQTGTVCQCTQNGQVVDCNVPPGNEADHGCNGIDDNCNGLIDDGLQCSGCAKSEICNGLDDDCNGMIDDTENGPMPGVGEDCGLDIGACMLGQLVCTGGKLVCVGAVGPTPEICNNIDDNCDGIVDQIQRQCYDFPTGCTDTDSNPETTNFLCKGICRPGQQTCTAGVWGTCAGEAGPQPELCNGRDDDCDGQIDEDFPDLGKECSVGVGICHTTGHFVCSPDGHGVVCDAPIVTGTTEVCNGLDDDCDGTVDNLPNPPPPPIGESCGTCGGKYVCQGGLLQCTGGTGMAEVCNGKDDDCNGAIDDGDMPGVGEACIPGAPDNPLFQLKGECKAGQQICVAGKLECVNYTGPTEEVCDGKDNNCDGMVDNMAICPNPSDVCYNAQCVQPCGAGEFPCAFGFFCKTLDEGRFCVPSPCFDKTCPTGQVCNNDTGQCTDPCAGVTCPAETVCRLGRCLDCFSTGCPANQICQADSGGKGHCMVDRCMGVTCPSGQTCTEGVCAGTACNGGCGQGEVCDHDRCVNACSIDICAGVTCQSGQVCQKSTGNCIADPCARTNCGSQDCIIACDGSAQCAPKAGVDVLATGGGGVACNVTGGSRPWDGVIFLLGIALAVVARRRRA